MRLIGKIVLAGGIITLLVLANIFTWPLGSFSQKMDQLVDPLDS